MDVKLSANLGFLWKELALPEAIRAAARAGFDAVECHFPYEVDQDEVNAALAETGLPMLSLNTRPGGEGEFGLAALPGREEEARAAIDQAIDYAATIECRCVHVMAGISGGGEEAEAVFRANLVHACEEAAEQGIGILVEPINSRDIPGYHLSTVHHAIDIVTALGHPNLKIMFDCYHMKIMHHGITDLIRDHLPLIGHIQIASVPDRSEPDHGEVDYPALARALEETGYDGCLGAEYRPAGTTDEGLGWMADMDRRAE